MQQPAHSTGVRMKLSASDRARLVRVIGRFSGTPVVMLGDLVADEFVYGQIARVSREAPVLILKQREKQVLPGGGANAANNLVDLGVRVILAGAAGEDEAGEALVRYFGTKGVDTGTVARPKEYRTPTKSRILGALGHGRPQQIVRVDHEPAEALEATLRRRLTATAAAHLSHAAAVLVSDYGYGATSPREVNWLRRQRNQRAGRPVPVTLDSRYQIRSYAQVTAATPNEQEMEQAFGAEIGDRLEMLDRLAAQVLKRQRFEALLVTRGREGMILYEPDRAPQALGIFGSDQVADVTGAGDTVIAGFTAALAAGAGFLDAARLANCAGGLVVMKSGTATVSARDLTEAIRNA
jgi:D-glycero-beta-D-manno-heptose-7-phosphate kinase